MSLSKRARLVLPLAALAAVAGLAVASQQVAAAFHYPREFGAGLFDVGRTRIYAPWSFVSWYFPFEARYPRAFDQASL